MSRGGLGTAGALIGGIVLGVVLSPAPVPETRFITIRQAPEIIVKREVKTRIVGEEIPESCATAIDIARSLSSLANRVHRNNEQALDRYDGLDLATMQDMRASIKLQIWLGEREKDSSRNLWALLELDSALDTYLRSCNKDQAAVENGEEVEFSDNQPFPVSGLY